MEKIKNTIIRLMEVVQKNRGTVLALGCMVVFITTYMLILPAFTLEADKAAEQGGIDVPETILEETSAEEDGSAVQEDQTEAGKTEDKQAETAAAGDDSVKEDTKKDQEDKEPATAEKKAGSEAKAEAETETSSGEALQFEGKGFSVSVDDTSSVLPGNTKLVVDELLENPTEGTKAERKEQQQAYKDYCDQAITAINDESASQNTKKTISFAKLYDISLQSSGDEITPDKPVSVTISYDQDTSKDLKVDKKADVRIVHFAQDEKTGEVTAELLDKDNVDVTLERSRMTETSFEAESFSVYAVVYTVDLSTYVVSASGDTYEVTVTFDETASIPADAELSVREISKTEKEYDANVKATNKQLKAQNDPEISDPVQFDISIMSNGEEIEPKEGSVVNVEIKLASEVFGKDAALDENKTDDDGEFCFNGEKLTLEEGAELTDYTVSHITDDGKAEIIDEVKSSIDENDNVVLTFDTESFSAYLMGNPQELNVLPSTIRVGDEIYMWQRADYYVTNIGTIVEETKHPTGQYGNDGSDWKTVRATNTGTFRIVHRRDWNDGNPYQNYKEITVLPAITETTPPGTIQTIDNASIGLTLNLFDYDLDNYLDDYFNNFNHGDHPVPSNFLNHGINNNHALNFWGSGIGDNYGSANKFDEHGVANIVQQNLAGGVGGYPQLRSDSNPNGSTESLAYLFSPSNGTDKEAYTNVNHLFKKDGDYYVYDSNTNYAYYDKSQGNGGNFAVYERTYKQKSGSESGAVQDKAIGFFPFHKWNEAHDLYVNWNKNLNHHFGMSMSVPFSLPKDPKAVVDTNGDPIVFEFSGDDDLWVFIDGKLAMDIGGVHAPTSGTINFQTGEVIVNGAQQSGFDFSNLYDGQKHTLQVFYIERGGCDSNCMIKFNLTQYGDIHFDKIDDDGDEDEPNEKLAGAVFGIYKDEACTDPLMENLKDGTSRAYVAESNAQGRVQFSDIPLGTYYLKELHAPEGYPLDTTVHQVNVFVDQVTGGVKVVVKIDGKDVELGVNILNRKPAPINLGIKKEWQNADGETIAAPEGVEATFEIKRIRTYETYTEETIEGQGRDVSHLTVGWIHGDQTHVYEEFDLVAGSTATISWGYVDGYTGSKDCIENGVRVDKDYVTGNVVSEALTMPAAGGSATFYIVDESENGEAIRNINVAGQQYYGNSGGGVIHTFETHTEPDPDFSYTGTNVTNNKVTLPINESTWEYLFENLPTFGRGSVAGVDHEVAFNYSYYLEEVNSTAPEGTTVVYKDLNGNVINSPTDAETHTSGTETIINKVPFGYLKIEKKVTYNGSDQNLTDAQKSKLAGDYKFKIYTSASCADEAVVKDDNGDDIEITITIGTDGQAVTGPDTPVKLVVGKYWIKEVESSNPAMFPVDNPIEVTVTKNHTTSSPVISTLTNNYDENNGPDKIAIDIEKKFQGLDDKSQVPSNFQVLLQYTLNGEPKTITLRNTELATGENGEKITWTHSTDGFTWHWKVTNINSEATNFKIKEENYDNAMGYDWKSATLNGTNITSTVTQYHDLTVTAPAATLTNVTSQRRTSDSGQNTEFYLEDNDILLSKLTAHQGTLVISKHPLNLAERDAVKNGLPNQFDDNLIFFSIEEHPNGFSFSNKSVTFGERDGKTTVKFTQNASAQEAVYSVSYSSEEARNNANLVNVYEEVPITIDIVKVDKDNNTTKLPGAVFTLRQLEDAAPVNGIVPTMPDTTSSDSAPTNSDGKTSFDNLTHGYYEITEKTAPPGYILSEETTFYFKIDSGVVTWLKKGTGKPSTWTEETSSDMISFEAAKAAEGEQEATNATFTVKNEPGTELPHTGGIGTAIFYIFGLLLAAGCGALLLRRIRFNR